MDGATIEFEDTRENREVLGAVVVAIFASGIVLGIGMSAIWLRLLDRP